MLAKRIALSFGLAVIFPLLVHYGVRTFSPEPRWEDYQAAPFDFGTATKEERRQHQAEVRRLQEQQRAAEKHFQTVLFFAAVPLGLAAILCGAFLSAQAVGTGLILGGIFSVCDGYISYWDELADALRFISLLVTFGVLLFIGYRKLEKKPT